MKWYLKSIKSIQNIVIFFSVIFLLIILPLIFSFAPDLLPEKTAEILFSVSHWSVLFVMLIRPLADLAPRKVPVRPLVILRKSFGILSASVIVMFLMVKVITINGYLFNYLNWDFWFSGDYKYLARIGDITAIILLVTSNNLSKKIFGKWWKRIQKLAYVYFYAGSLYIGLVFENKMALIGALVVTILVIAVWIKNKRK